MSIAVTLIDDYYAANKADGTKDVRLTVSLTNPYTAGGESITVSSYFPHLFLGGGVEMVQPSVAAADAGTLAASTIRGTTASTTTVVLQLFNAGLSGTASAGRLVDNTVANISNYTCTVRLTGY